MHPQLHPPLGSKAALIGMDQEQLSSTSEEVTEKTGSNPLQWCIEGQWKITDKLKQEVLLCVRKMRTGKQWNRLLREVVHSPSMEVFKT